jgi:hypothetical protein
MADSFATVIIANSLNLVSEFSFNKVKKWVMTDGNIPLLFNKDYQRDTGDIINDSQKIFRTTIEFI